MELDASLYWLALAVTPGLAARLTARLLRHFSAPEAVFRASLTELEACHLPAPVAQNIHSQAPLKAAEKELAQVKRLGCRLLNWNEPEYPKRLLEIYDPPALLYLRGDPQVLTRHSISIVGTRRPTPYGNQMAERLARDLAERGLVIVSGLARGIDSSAHKGACAAARGAVIGVLGNGIDIIYPKENKKLYALVEQRGAIITE
ncbi:MAG TPA: DNA-processing protein DprA, partial [Myxococcales bacterium]